MSQPGFGRGFVGGRHNVDSLNESGQTRMLLEVRFGSLAVIKDDTSLTSAFGGKADIGVLQSHLFVGPFVSPAECFSENVNESEH